MSIPVLLPPKYLDLVGSITALVRRITGGSNQTVKQLEDRIAVLEATVVDLQDQIDTHHP